MKLSDLKYDKTYWHLNSRRVLHEVKLTPHAKARTETDGLIEVKPLYERKETWVFCDELFAAEIEALRECALGYKSDLESTLARIAKLESEQ